MASRIEIRRWMIQLIRDRTWETDVDEESNFIRDLGVDSIDMLNFITETEQHFDIEIPEKDVMKFAVVREAIDYLHENIKE